MLVHNGAVNAETNSLAKKATSQVLFGARLKSCMEDLGVTDRRVFGRCSSRKAPRSRFARVSFCRFRATNTSSNRERGPKEQPAGYAVTPGGFSPASDGGFGWCRTTRRGCGRCPAKKRYLLSILFC